VINGECHHRPRVNFVTQVSNAWRWLFPPILQRTDEHLILLDFWKSDRRFSNCNAKWRWVAALDCHAAGRLSVETRSSNSRSTRLIFADIVPPGGDGKPTAQKRETQYTAGIPGHLNGDISQGRSL